MGNWLNLLLIMISLSLGVCAIYLLFRITLQLRMLSKLIELYIAENRNLLRNVMSVIQESIRALSVELREFQDKNPDSKK
jgi:hypothetical protein